MGSGNGEKIYRNNIRRGPKYSAKNSEFVQLHSYNFYCSQVKQFIERYGRRLWKLRVLQAELKMTLRETADSPEQSFRFFVNTESGYSIETFIYNAVEDPNSGKYRLLIG